ncbi:MAG: D-alanine--D-alanine ligase [Bacteroidetes bacterium]|nr:D-alanine--D-alanine ligase [Bacteroidota bacterium]
MRVGVIFGGRSGEHEVSLMSATNVLRALDPEKYEVVPIGITRQGRWLTQGDALAALKAGSPDGEVAAFLADPSQRGLVAVPAHGNYLHRAMARKVDVVIPVLHGTYGEDGTVQGLLELLDVPYVGAGVAASAVGMDKAMMKDIFLRHGLPSVDFTVVKRREWRRDPAGLRGCLEARFSYPLFVKPVNLGSSVGISKVHNTEELPAAMDLAAAYDRKILVEEAALGCREVECAVLGNDEPIASVPAEIIPGREFYDYAAKYLDEESRVIIPAELPEATVREVQRLAVAAFLAIDCAGMARVDFFVGREDGRVILNEINTIPGFTAISAYPKMWEASGLSVSALLDRLIELALERYAEKHECRTDYGG